MPENPYQYSGECEASSSFSERPIWVYAMTILAAILSGIVPASICVMLYYYLRPDSYQLNLGVAGAVATSLLVSFIVGRRTWVRLNRVHLRVSELRLKRQRLLSTSTKIMDLPKE